LFREEGKRMPGDLLTRKEIKDAEERENHHQVRHWTRHRESSL